jgi:predicted kinase
LQACTLSLPDGQAPHIITLLSEGLLVILDFQAITLESRALIRWIIDQANVAHQLHVLAPPDEACLARLKQRNASGEHQFAVTEEQFHQVSKCFVAPTPDEGFNLLLHD